MVTTLLAPIAVVLALGSAVKNAYKDKAETQITNLSTNPKSSDTTQTSFIKTIPSNKEENRNLARALSLA